MAPDNRSGDALSANSTTTRAMSAGTAPAFKPGAARRSIAVSTAPGATQNTDTPCGRASTASAAVSPLIPHLLTV